MICPFSLVEAPRVSLSLAETRKLKQQVNYETARTRSDTQPLCITAMFARATDTDITDRPRAWRKLTMTDKDYEDIRDYMDDDDDRFYSQTAYNEYYYREKEQELIKEIHAEIEDKEMREREELEEYLSSLSDREYIEWKREFRKETANCHPLYGLDTKEAIIYENKRRYPFAATGDQIRAIEEEIMSMEEESESEDSISFFKILGPVIEKEIDVITRQRNISIEETYDLILSEAKRNQKEWYSNRVPNLNYVDPVCRLAYLYIVAAANAGMFKHVLEEHAGLRDYLLGKATESGEVKICTFGAGPGTELLAIAKFFYELDLGLNVHVDFHLLDKVEMWASSWLGIRDQVNHFFRTFFSNNRSQWPIVPSGNLIPCDVTDLNALSRLGSVWNQDVYVLNFLLSEIFDDNPACRAFMAGVVSLAPKGSHFVFIERKGPMWEQRITTIATQSGLKLSSFFRSESTLKGERPEDLGAIYQALSRRQRVPRLTWNVVYSIGVKQ